MQAQNCCCWSHLPGAPLEFAHVPTMSPYTHGFARRVVIAEQLLMSQAGSILALTMCIFFAEVLLQDASRGNADVEDDM